MSDFDTISGVQEILHIIIEQINKGDVSGLMFQMTLDTGQTLTGWTNNLSYIERLGLLEVAKQDVTYADEDNCMGV